MPVCGVCNQERFLIHRRYQGIKVRPARCIGCIVRFPPNGVELAINNGAFTLRPWLEKRVFNHAWTLIGQTKKVDIWYCPYCRKNLESPKLGVPSSAGCPRGLDTIFRKIWWVDIKRVTTVLCPLCDNKAEIVTVKRLLRKRPRKSFFPYTCGRCYD